MDKFLATLCFIIVGALVLAISNTFENKSSASTFKSGAEVLLKHNNNRSPSIVPNKGN